MSTDQPSLVLVQPDDTIASIEHKVRLLGVPFVQLLVADGAGALQTPNGFAELRQALGSNAIDLLVFSSDARTLQAAAANQFLAVPVQGAQVNFAPPAAPAALPPEQAFTQPLHAPQLPPAGHADAVGTPSSDDDFLSALDRVPLGGEYDAIHTPAYSPFDDDPAVYDDIHDQPITQRGAAAPIDADDADDADAPWAEEADAWDIDDQPERTRSVTSAAAPAIRARPVRRDGAVPAEDWRRQVAPLAPAASGGAAVRRTRPARPVDDDRYDDVEDERPRRSVLVALLPLLFLLLVAGVAAYWFFSTRTTVAVVPPSTQSLQRAFANEVIPLDAQAAAPNQSTATIQAEQVEAAASATAQGQASKQQVPASVARGNVSFINRLGQAIELPEGTEFVGTNGDGQEVRFLIDAPATIPPAVTTSSATGSSTTFGTVDVAISARSPGAASNVPANAITQMVLPGQGPVQSNNNLTISQPNPVSGGDEQERYVVTQEDVQRVLGDALTKLYNEASITSLSAKITKQRYEIDPSTLMPNPQALANPDSYSVVSVQPNVGQAIEGDNPAFQVTVQSTFKALAVPSGNLIQQQLQQVASSYFNERCPAGTTFSGASIGTDDAATPGWQWDGTRLTVNGSYSCAPNPQEIRTRVLGAVKGQSYEAAVNNLDQLQNDHLIGGYTLPSGKAQFPNYDFLFDIRVAQLAGAQPASGPGEPTSAAQPSAAPEATGAPTP